MIANLIGFLKPTLILFFIFNVFNTNAAIKSVDLVYDKTSIYKGFSPVFSIKVTKTNGKVFYSTDQFTKYPCLDFTFKVSKEIGFVGPSKQYFNLKIPKDYTDDNITLEMKLNYASSNKVYKFKIPIYNAVDHVKSLHLYLNRDNVFNDQPLPYKIFADLDEDEGLEIQNRKISFNDIQLSVIKGGKYDPIQSKIIPKRTNLCDSLLIVRVALKNKPEIYTDETFIIHKTKQNTYFAGTTGTPGKNGHSPFHDRDGTDGGDGLDCPDLTLFLSIGIHPCTKDSVLILDNGRNNSEFEPLYFSLYKPNIELDASGGDGGHGGNGHDGAFGQNGESGTGIGGSGGDGGDGGDGGNGGNGGDGGNVKIVYTPACEKYISQIIVYTHGGHGGSYGHYGRYGKKGLAGRGTQGNGVMGRDGYNGRDGESGRDGQAGKVEFIQYSDYLKSNIK